MPKIFEYFGFIFFFYSNEHEPIHVHVTHNNCGMVFELIIENGTLKEIRKRRFIGMDDLPSKDLVWWKFSSENIIKTSLRSG